MVFCKKSELFQVFVEIQHFLCSEKSGILPFFTDLHGFALGGGCELSMACDIRLASEKARFGRIFPLVQLQQVGNPLSLYDGETRADSQGRHVLVGYDKDPA